MKAIKTTVRKYYKNVEEYSLPAETERKYYKYGTTPNAFVMGNPVINNGVVSGFSSSNYLQVFQSFDISTANSWEINTKVTTGNNITDQQSIFGGSRFTSRGSSCGALIDIYASNIRFIVPLTSNISSKITLEYNVEQNETYLIKAEFTGSAYNLYINNTLVRTTSTSHSLRLPFPIWTKSCLSRKSLLISHLQLNTTRRQQNEQHCNYHRLLRRP